MIAGKKRNQKLSINWMKNDFEGKIHDVPDNVQNDNEENHEEELDREMGDSSDPNEEFISGE